MMQKIICPIIKFQQWLTKATAEKTIDEPNAMTLSTVSSTGMPYARIVLLKKVTLKGFVFYTNYQSNKACHLDAHPKAALTFFWPRLKKQVNIRGYCTKTDAVVSDLYFHGRARKSQIGAWASNQSSIIDHKNILKKKIDFFEKKFTGKSIPRPPYWGGYRLQPTSIEFWEEQPYRLHDRWLYTKKMHHKIWKQVRLSP